MLFQFQKHTNIEDYTDIETLQKSIGTSITMMKKEISKQNESIQYKHYTTRLRKERE